MICSNADIEGSVEVAAISRDPPCHPVDRSRHTRQMFKSVV